MADMMDAGVSCRLGGPREVAATPVLLPQTLHRLSLKPVALVLHCLEGLQTSITQTG